MALPLLLIFNAGRIISIAVVAGTALARFVVKNPKILGSTISVQAISAAIQSYTTNEKEKIDIVNDIGKENSQLKYDLLRNIFYPHTDLLSNIAPYLVILLIIYILLKK